MPNVGTLAISTSLTTEALVWEEKVEMWNACPTESPALPHTQTGTTYLGDGPSSVSPLGEGLLGQGLVPSPPASLSAQALVRRGLDRC